jgi:hypothetical protein
VLGLVGLSAPVRAAQRTAAIEIDARAEAIIDPRAVRRLVQLELADVDVRPAPGRADTELFVRVLGAGDGQLRIELWERGTVYGARTVAGATGSVQLVARRVALAAAELARELSDERDDAALAVEAERQRALAAARAANDRARNGPRALRSGFVGSWSKDLVLAGPELQGELHLYRALRLDLGATLAAGYIDDRHPAEQLALELGPARRFALGRGWDLDAGILAAAGVLQFPSVRGVDGIAGQHQTWSARLEGRLRLEPWLSKSARLVLGVGGGMTLRKVPVELDPGDTRRLGGPFVSAELALVLTPF